MKVLHLSDYRCPYCPQSRDPQHKCLCQLKAELATPGSNERSLLIMALVLFAAVLVGCVVLWAGVGR